MITLNFDEVLERTYNAKKGVDVRYGLGQGFEYCKQFADEAQGYANDAKASEKKATDAVAGIEQTKTDAVQAVQNAQTTATTAVQQAQSTATTAVTTKQTEAVQAVGTAKAGAVKAVDDERDAALQQVANSTQAAQTAASDAAASEQAAQASKEAAATSAGAAESSATAASGSASAAATSESNAASSAQSAETDADRAEAAAELAGTRANTDKTLTTKNAPADAAATGEAIAKKADKDVILDSEGNVIFYSKAAVDELLAGKLDLTGGTMSGPISILNAGDYVLASNNTVAGKDSLISIKNEADGNAIGFGIGNGGLTCGIIDWSKLKWLIHTNKGEDALYLYNEKCLGFVVASGSNYVRFGDGKQICFGIKTGVNGALSSTSNQIVFPIPFSAIPAFVAAIHGSAGGRVIISGYENTTSVCLGIADDSSINASVPWIAVGYWK